MKKNPSPVPVFLIYAGIIHAIGLALLLPMMVTLPGPGAGSPPETSILDVEIVPAPSAAANVVGEDEETAALPQDEPAIENASGEDGGAAAEATPDATPIESEPGAPSAPSAAKSAPKKPARPVRATSRRPAKSETKIAPFNGALSGLFAPAPPVKKR